MQTVAVLVFFSTLACAQSPADRKEWVPIFNGKNLDGWVVKLAHHELGDNFGGTFRVENGVIKVSYDKYPEFGSRFGHLGKTRRRRFPDPRRLRRAGCGLQGLHRRDRRAAERRSGKRHHRQGERAHPE